MSRIKLAILGQGRSGRDIHAANLSLLKDLYEIVAVVDPLPDRRERAAAEIGCATYADYRELLGHKDIDLVVNATPSHLHVPVTLDLLSHGFNVLVEKPMARHVADVDAMIEAAQKAGRTWRSSAVTLCPLFPEGAGDHRQRRSGSRRPDQHRIQRLRAPLGLAVHPGLQRRQPAQHRSAPARPGIGAVW